MTGKKKNDFNKRSHSKNENLRNEARESHVIGLMILFGSIFMGYQAVNAHEDAHQLQENKNEYVTEIKEDFRSSCALETSRLDVSGPQSPAEITEQCMTEKANGKIGEEYKKLEDKKESRITTGVLLFTFGLSMLVMAHQTGKKARNNQKTPKP